MVEVGSRSKLFQARLAVTLIGLFIVIGAAVYGLSSDTFHRMWQNLSDRPGGPMTFRIILQPLMAAATAVVDGIKDARAGRTAYLWTILTVGSARVERLQDGVISTARIILLGLGIDVIYQVIVLKTFYPGEAVVVAILLAFVPYLLLRGPAARIVGRFLPEPAKKDR